MACHGEKKHKGDLRVSELVLDVLSSKVDDALAGEILKRIIIRKMPLTKVPVPILI